MTFIAGMDIFLACVGCIALLLMAIAYLASVYEGITDNRRMTAEHKAKQSLAATRKIIAATMEEDSWEFSKHSAALKAVHLYAIGLRNNWKIDSVVQRWEETLNDSELKEPPADLSNVTRILTETPTEAVLDMPDVKITTGFGLSHDEDESTKVW